MFWSLLWYGGLILSAAAAVFALRPNQRLGVPTRRRALRLGIAGIVMVAVSLFAGGARRRVADPVTALDRFIPAYQFNEVHRIDISAAAERTYRAVLDVTPEEISFYRALTWVRRGGSDGPESILNPAPGKPLLESAVRTGFRMLAQTANREVVFGGFVVAPAHAIRSQWTEPAYIALEEPGFAKVAMNFRLEPRGASACVLSTETRVYATDAATRRIFKVYWRTIYPGSAIIRRSWLGAIKRRAEL
jgi:hypothetical protein